MNVEIPVSLAISPDGRHLWVITSFGRVFVFDTQQSRVVAGPFDVGSSASNNPEYDLALTPDGRRALVINRETNGMTVIDAVRLRPVDFIPLPNPNNAPLDPVAVVVAPDGRRAFVANQGNESVSVVDLAQGKAADPIPLLTASSSSDNRAMDIAITPQGDRLYVALEHPNDDAAGLFYLPLGRQYPDDWTVSSGFVTPLPYSDTYHLTAVLGPITPDEAAARPARPTALSQVVTAVGGCTYDFSFWGISNSYEAVAEVIWRGDGCRSQRVDRLPIQPFEQDKRNQPTVAARTRTLPELQLHRARLVAPAGATQAEIRFLVPPEMNAIVDSVSFQATLEGVSNNDLRYAPEDVLADWELLPETALLTLVAEAEQVRLSNVGAAPCALSQSFAVGSAAQPFILTFRGRTLAQLGVRQPPQVALHWLDANNNPTGTTTSLVIAEGDDVHRLNATVPAGAVKTELQLMLPQGTTLAVKQLSFQPVELITVPIHFLAQAPGKLTVTHFQVAFDVADRTKPATPAAGLCPATPPGRCLTLRGETAGKGGCCRWCAKACEACAEDKVSDPVVQAGSGRRTVPMAALRRYALAQPTAGRAAVLPPIQPIEAEIAAILPMTEAGWAALASDLTLTAVPLTLIEGIGPKRAEALAAMSITNIRGLATAVPATLAALKGVTLAMAHTYIAEAQNLVAHPEKLPAPLVSCIMPTHNHRAFVPTAIEQFLRQDYPNRELIIVDDGSDPVADLVPNDARVRYVQLSEKQTVGAKRNLACQQAQGSIIANWDDDVWVAAWRLSYQVAALVKYQADVCGLDNLLHYSPLTGQAWHSVRPPGAQPWMPGSTYCYRKAFWQANPYPDVPVGADIRFLRQKPTAKIVPLLAITWLVDIVHEADASPKPTDSALWYTYPAAEIQTLMGSDWVHFQARSGQ